MKCKEKTPTVGVHQIMNKNGLPMSRGNCCRCKKSGGFVFILLMLAAAAATAASLAGGATTIANSVNQKKNIR